MKNKDDAHFTSHSLWPFIGMTMLVWLGVPGQASATIIDLTATNSSGTINGALFHETNINPAGSGYGALNAFLKIKNEPRYNIEQGYNTDYRYPQGNGPSSVEFDQFTDHHTRALTLAEVPQVTIGGVKYLEFLLDINEPVAMGNVNKDYLLSLDALQIFIGDGPDLHDFSNNLDPNYDWDSHATKIYDMDQGDDSWAKLSYWPDVGGSGWADYSVYIPIPDLIPSGGYVYLYSKFGENFACDNNFEEWGISAMIVPEPATLLLFGTGLLGLVGTIRRKKKQPCPL